MHLPLMIMLLPKPPLLIFLPRKVLVLPLNLIVSDQFISLLFKNHWFMCHPVIWLIHRDKFSRISLLLQSRTTLAANDTLFITALSHTSFRSNLQTMSCSGVTVRFPSLVDPLSLSILWLICANQFPLQILPMNFVLIFNTLLVLWSLFRINWSVLISPMFFKKRMPAS